MDFFMKKRNHHSMMSDPGNSKDNNMTFKHSQGVNNKSLHACCLVFVTKTSVSNIILQDGAKTCLISFAKKYFHYMLDLWATETMTVCSVFELLKSLLDCSWKY